MASVKGDIRLNDMFTSVLNKMHSAITSTVREMENMTKVMGKDVSTRSFEKIEEDLYDINKELQEATKHQDEFNNKVREGKDAFSDLGNMVKAIGIGAGLKQVVGLADTLTQNEARLGFLTDDTDTLKNQIYASAQRSRASYTDMQSIVASLGMQAGDAFGNDTNQILAFSENLNKMFTTSGMDANAISSVMYNMTQSLSSGALLGQDYKIISQNAPQMIQYLEDFYGVNRKELNDMVSKGQVTAQGLKQAILNATDDINADFKKMPMTWGQVWTMTVNKIIKISQPLLDFISLLADNWETLEPIILGVAAAVGIYEGALLLYNIQQGISNGLQTLGAIAAVAHGTATVAETAATTGLTTAQVAFNAALYACPLTWILLIIIAIIAIIYAAVAAVNKATDSTISATGLIFGMLLEGVANFYNGVIRPIWNYIVAFVNFFANVFNDPVASIQILFIDLARNVIGILDSIAKHIDFLFGSNFSATTGGWLSELEAQKEKIKAESGYEEVMEELGQWNPQDAFNVGYAFGEGIDEKVGDFLNGSALDDLLGGGEVDVGNVKNVENVSGTIDVASEDLKLLRELAEQKYIQNNISAAPVLYVNTGDIHENADIEYLIGGVRDKIAEGIESAMEGVPVS